MSKFQPGTADKNSSILFSPEIKSEVLIPAVEPTWLMIFFNCFRFDFRHVYDFHTGFKTYQLIGIIFIII